MCKKCRLISVSLALALGLVLLILSDKFKDYDMELFFSGFLIIVGAAFFSWRILDFDKIETELTDGNPTKVVKEEEENV